MKSDVLTCLNDPAMRLKLSTDYTLVKRLAHELDNEPSTVKVEKAFLSIAKDRNARNIIRALIRALPNQEMTILNNASAVFANHASLKAVGPIFPIVVEYERKILRIPKKDP